MEYISINFIADKSELTHSEYVFDGDDFVKREYFTETMHGEQHGCQHDYLRGKVTVSHWWSD